MGRVELQYGQLTLFLFPFAPFPFPLSGFATAATASGPVPAVAAGWCPAANKPQLPGESQNLP